MKNFVYIFFVFFNLHCKQPDGKYITSMSYLNMYINSKLCFYKELLHEIQKEHKENVEKQHRVMGPGLKVTRESGGRVSHQGHHSVLISHLLIAILLTDLTQHLQPLSNHMLFSIFNSVFPLKLSL